MPVSDHARFEKNSLVLQVRGGKAVLPARDVEQVYDCRMADPVAHGDEAFHIVLTRTEFFLLGPFLDGGLGAIDALKAVRPEIPVASRFVGRVPFRYRQRGWLRLFPIPGAGKGPIGDLTGFGLTSGGGEDE